MKKNINGKNKPGLKTENERLKKNTRGAPVENEKKDLQGYRQNAGNNTQASEMMQDGRGDYR